VTISVPTVKKAEMKTVTAFATAAARFAISVTVRRMPMTMASVMDAACALMSLTPAERVPAAVPRFAKVQMRINTAAHLSLTNTAQEDSIIINA